MRKEYDNISLDALNIPARCLAKSVETVWKLGKYPVVLLSGKMGSGKTTFVSYFVRNLCKELGANVESLSIFVNSPTYTFLNEYPLPIIRNAIGEFLSIYHFDLYRLSDEADTDDLGFYDYWGRQGICLVEWWERAGENFTSLPFAIQVKIEENTEETRNLSIEWNGSGWKRFEPDLHLILKEEKEEVG
ncbi:tRNA threonylcarbamoyl adenosine modification protein YjeE [Leptospira fainei serovar Hurstbridge str. BUT 6]|uniref:tRNA threonylcarbamoyladenosine biosynthesis protein TsaE n=1 Tax=Leptospira fainei serovar Hurstbridge str. BUT 6 TaxID=1193011 RepID=S3UWH5_9LEPT|nr:tRNA (adenosine(37)-N6)-threonylcarbamoyltransferase complex ATPase subunit type 1 TsaE [Leptospira fainei]EPG73603.1 tRNA threonylcarbamoyl adenosine modification protein YjeE [Leptospira fainei serovar Hurstbridge str. BUT 6]